MLTDYFRPISEAESNAVYELATRLVRRGHDVMVITPTRSRPPREVIDGISVACPAIQLARLTGMQVSISPRTITAMRAVRSFRPDVVHTHSRFFLSATAPILKIARRAPLITTLHVAELAHLDGWQRFAARSYEASVSRVLLARSDQVTVVSEAVRRHAIGALHVDERKLTLITNGVDVDRFRPADNRGVDGASKTVVFVGGSSSTRGRSIDRWVPQIIARHPRRGPSFGDTYGSGTACSRSPLARRCGNSRVTGEVPCSAKPISSCDRRSPKVCR
jgi:glycosyltransferase involved in cell wall biosynthesis